MMKLIIPLIFISIVGGCASAPTQEEVANADYGRPLTQVECETIVKKDMRYYLKDPDSAQYNFDKCAKDALPSIPLFGIPKQYGYAMIAHVNAKNSFGGYVGSQPHGYLIKDGIVIRRVKRSESNPYVYLPF